MKVKLRKGAYMPERAHETDAGYDLRSPVSIDIPARSHVNINTGVSLQIPNGYCGFIKSRSGLNSKCGLTSEGVIDSGYRGEIVVTLRNHTDASYTVKRGDKISQIVFLPVFAEEMEAVDVLDESDRGEAGFGSTGK